MNEQKQKEQEISPQTFNMAILDFLVNYATDFWNVNEIAGKAGITSQNNTRIKHSMQFFANKKFVIKLSELDPDDQKETKRKSVKNIISESYKITQLGKDTYKKIMDSCLDSVGLRLLSFKKIE